MDDNIVNIAELFMTTIISMAPRDSLNLVRSIGYNVYDDNNVEITIGGEVVNGIKVDYAPYTNEKWEPPVNLEYFPSGKKRTEYEKRKLKSYRTGGENPNEGWVDAALEQVSILLAEIGLGMVIKK